MRSDKKIFKFLRKRWRDSLVSYDTGFMQDMQMDRRLQLLAAEAADYQRSMNRAENKSCLWQELQDPGNLYKRDPVCLKTCRRIERMALAYCTKGCSLKGNEALGRDILTALEFIYRNWYNEKLRKGGEWWHKEIGIPLCLNTCVLLMYEEIEKEKRRSYMRAVESFTSEPQLMCIEDTPEISTGANRAWKCLALAECGILTNDEDKLWTSHREIKAVFGYTESGDGFYRDGSFIQHLKFSYTGGYGISFLSTIADFVQLLRDTPWQMEEKELSIVQDWISGAFEPFVFRGGFMSMTRGRETAREFSEEHAAGHELLWALLKLSDSLPQDAAFSLKSKLKYWILSDTVRDFQANAPAFISSLAARLLKDPKIPAYEFEPFCKICAAMDRVVHRRRAFTAGISMSSQRTAKYESIHGENVRGWYTADGAVWLYNADAGQYSEGYFPTVNAYRLPGITVDTIPRKQQGVDYGKEAVLHKTWAGGAVLNEMYGTAGMDLEAECSDLQAKKSWFLFDREIVCLGAGITCTGGREIETVAENRKISADEEQVLTVNGKGLDLSGKVISDKFRYIHLKGRAEGSDIGYYFPKGGSIELLKEKRTDSWSSINRYSGSEKKVSNTFINIVIHHGKNPENAGYQYILLPGMSRDETERYSKASPVEVLQNTPRVQAVRHREINITAANFWEDGGYSAGGISCDRKAAVILQEKEGCIDIAASDPTWQNTEGIRIELERAVAGIKSCDREIRVIRLQPEVVLWINTKNAMGKSFHVCLTEA